MCTIAAAGGGLGCRARASASERDQAMIPSTTKMPTTERTQRSMSLLLRSGRA